MLIQNPGFSLVAVLSLGLGIGANTAIFSLVDAVLLRWLPVRSPQELVVVARNPNKPNVSFNYPDYEYIRDHNQSFAGIVAASLGGQKSGMVINGRGEAQLVTVSQVSGNYFDVLGVRPALGRLLTADDNKVEGGHPVAVLSYDAWQRRFGGDAAVLGESIAINGTALSIVGVSGSGFRGTAVGIVPEVFAPIMMRTQLDGSRNWNTRHYWWLNVIARMKPGVNPTQAAAEMTILFNQIEKNDPERKPARSFVKDEAVQRQGAILPGSGGYSFVRNRMSKPLTVLMIVVGLVLLIACANVANLLLARAAGRRKEISIRAAIGAGRGRLISQMLTETIMISLLGGAAGLLFAYGGVAVLLRLLPQGNREVILNVTPDLRLLGFTFGISLLTGLLCGLVPALKASRPDLLSALKNDTGAQVGRIRFDARKVLAVVQVAVSMLLLIGAGLLVRSLGNLRDLDPGFVKENLLLVEVDPSRNGYKGQRLRVFYDQLLAKTRTMPGVVAASLTSITPLSGSRWNQDVAIEGYQWKPQEKPYIDMNSASPGYFQTLGIPLLAGRDFSEQDEAPFTPDPPEKREPNPKPDTSGPPHVAVINEALAKRFFGTQNPLGRRFSQSEKFQVAGSYEIVGVVRDTRYFGLREDVESLIYLPNWRVGASSKTLCVRTAGKPAQLVDMIRREVHNLDASIPVLRTQTMEQQFDGEIVTERIVTTLCSFFGVLALLLAAVGLYGLMAQAVTRRTREIGIRMALGAERRSVLWLMLRDAVILVAIGTAIGIPVAFGVTRFIASFLYGLGEHDIVTMLLAAGLLAGVTAIAAYVPARRATKVDPMVALRYD